jgi:hypothetical protein
MLASLFALALATTTTTTTALAIASGCDPDCVEAYPVGEGLCCDVDHDANCQSTDRTDVCCY